MNVFNKEKPYDAPMTWDDARGIAARIWCQARNSAKVMDVDLAESFAKVIHDLYVDRLLWLELAKQEIQNAEYYRSLVVEIGKAIGQEARVADDGLVHDSVLCAKVPELVKKRLAFYQQQLKDAAATGIWKLPEA